MSSTQLETQWRIQQIEQPRFIANQQAYAIIEPILWPEWEQKLQAHLDPLESTPLMAGTRLSHLDNGPILVTIGLSVAALQECCLQMSQMPCGCLVWSPISHTFEQVADSLRQRLILSREKGQALFRFYEPRTLLPLMAVLNDEERQQLFPLISQIDWYHKTWLSITLPQVGEVTTLIPSWTLSSKQLSTMAHIAQQW